MIRIASPDEAETVATVLIESRRVFLPFAPFAHPEPEVRQWVRSQLMRTQRVEVWEEDGAIVAVLATTEEPPVSWIDHLYVLPGWNGKRIGTKLLQHAHVILIKPIEQTVRCW